jgi:hypothetical protein
MQQVGAKRRRVEEKDHGALLRTAVWTEAGGRVRLVWRCAAWQVAAGGVLMPVQWAAPPPPPRHGDRVQDLVVKGVEGWARLQDDLRASFLLGHLARMLPDDVLRCILGCQVLTPGHRVRVGAFAFLNPAVARMETLRRRKREAEGGLRVLVGSRLVAGDKQPTSGRKDGERDTTGSPSSSCVSPKSPQLFVSPVGFRRRAVAPPPVLCI